DPLIIQILQAILAYDVWVLLDMLSSDIVYVGLVGTIYWCINKRQGKIAVNLLMFSSFFNILFKYAFHMDRPPSTYRQGDYVTDASYGFPSGAAQTSTTFWAWASVKLRRWWVWIVGIIFVTLTALARMGLGMHWLGDVIGGILIGIIIVTMAYFLVPFFLERWEKMSQVLQDWLLPIMALIFFIIFSAAYLVVPYFPTENIAVSMGVVFGFSVGATLEARYINFEIDVPRNTKIIRAIISLILAIILFYAFDIVFDILTISFAFLAFTFRFLKYVIVGFFGAFLIPLIFKSIGK
ncbi:MAG: phosphatase PAP2 family protein, partial [Promethearchaeota archaeon]